MKEIYDIITKKIIDIPNRKLMEVSKSLGLDYTSVGRLIRGELTHVASRYILPENANTIFTLVNFDNGEKYQCVTTGSLFYYLGKKPNANEIKYIDALISGRQKCASICGIVLHLLGEEKKSRPRKMKADSLNLIQLKLQCKLKSKISSRLRCRIRSALHSSKKNKTRELIGCNVDFLMGYLEKQFTNGMSWENYGKWHIDHIWPLSSFNLQDVKQQKVACHYSNLQPLWENDNFTKSDKLPLNPPEPATPQNIS